MIPVLEHFHFQPLGKRVDDGQPHAVQPARNLISPAAEFAARVELGQHDFDRGDLLRMVHGGRDSPAVVRHRTGAVRVQRHDDGIAVTGKRLVDGIVDDLLHEVMQPFYVRRADVHPRALANGIQPLQNLNLPFAVICGYFCPFFHFLSFIPF